MRKSLFFVLVIFIVLNLSLAQDIEETAQDILETASASSFDTPSNLEEAISWYNEGKYSYVSANIITYIQSEDIPLSEVKETVRTLYLEDDLDPRKTINLIEAFYYNSDLEDETERIFPDKDDVNSFITELYYEDPLIGRYNVQTSAGDIESRINVAVLSASIKNKGNPESLAQELKLAVDEGYITSSTLPFHLRTAVSIGVLPAEVLQAAADNLVSLGVIASSTFASMAASGGSMFSIFLIESPIDGIMTVVSLFVSAINMVTNMFESITGTQADLITMVLGLSFLFTLYYFIFGDLAGVVESSSNEWTVAAVLISYSIYYNTFSFMPEFTELLLDIPILNIIFIRPWILGWSLLDNMFQLLFSQSLTPRFLFEVVLPFFLTYKIAKRVVMTLGIFSERTVDFISLMVLFVYANTGTNIILAPYFMVYNFFTMFFSASEPLGLAVGALGIIISFSLISKFLFVLGALRGTDEMITHLREPY